MSPLIKVNDLKVHFKKIKAVDGISFSINESEILSLVGESGSGKSVTALSLLKLEENAKGSILLYDKDLLKLSEKELSKIRGKEISLIFQDSSSFLSPYKRIIDEMIDALRLHSDLSKKESRERALEMLEEVGIKKERGGDYIHAFSGGEKKRIAIATALLNHPRLLIADEITSSLDSTTEREILKLLLEMRKKYSLSILFITHDLNLAKTCSDRIMVMYKGRIVEEGKSSSLFLSPMHPYTKDLIDASLMKKEKIEGAIANIIDEGCPYQNRCKERMEICKTDPPSININGHIVSCHLYKGKSDE